MAWFDTKKNRGHIGGRELGFGLGYGVATKYEMYKTTEEYVGYGSSYPGMHGYGPDQRKEMVHKDHGVGDNHARPWTSTGPKKGDMFGKNKYVHRDNSPPPRDHLGKFNHNYYPSDDEEDDVVCDDEQCYPKPKYMKDNEKHKVVDHTSVPHHEASNPNNGYINHNINNNRPTYTVPVTAQPRKDPYYENSNRTVVHNPPPPVKTRPDHQTKIRGTVDSPVSVEARGSPFASSRGSPFASSRGSPFASSPGSPFTPSPRKEHGYGSREDMDSPREGRWHTGATPRPRVVAGEVKNKGIIDSKEAAKKYGGVFVGY